MVCLSADPSNGQTDAHVFGEEKSTRRKKQEEEEATSKAATGALLVGAACLPVCARSGGIAIITHNDSSSVATPP